MNPTIGAMAAARSTAIVLSVVCSVLVPGESLADAVTDWNANAANAARAACLAPALDPFHESRAYAMMHIAIHDALNAIDRRSRPYVYDARSVPWASSDAAVAAAAREVLVSAIAEAPSFEGVPGCLGLLQAGIDRVEADYTAALAAIPDGLPKTIGLRTGRRAAAAILALRAADGSDTPFADPAIRRACDRANGASRPASSSRCCLGGVMSHPSCSAAVRSSGLTRHTACGTTSTHGTSRRSKASAETM